MKVLLVADGRSPITRNWVKALKAIDVRVSLLSTFLCNDVPFVEKTTILPVAFSQFSGSQVQQGKIRNSGRIKQILLAPLRKVLLAARYLVGPLSVRAAHAKYLAIIAREKPDIVQALRIPFEGMLAVTTPKEIPLIISVWGNDLTLHASGSPWMRKETRRVLQRADGLLADTQRDIDLSRKWGFAGDKPSLVVPGNGGIVTGAFNKLLPLSKDLEKLIPKGKTLILNPRGMRVYVRNDTFFRAVPLVVKERPRTHFACVSMAGQPEAERWVKKLGIEKNVTLLPFISQADLWALFQRATLSISISTHDGTPNTLLEAMAAGSFPICGDIDSIREWITDGTNGLLVQPDDHPSLSGAILKILKDENLRKRGVQINRRLVAQKAEQTTILKDLKKFFQQFRITRT